MDKTDKQYSVPYQKIGKVLIGNPVTATSYKIHKQKNNGLSFGKIYRKNLVKLNIKLVRKPHP